MSSYEIIQLFNMNLIKGHSFVITKTVAVTVVNAMFP